MSEPLPASMDHAIKTVAALRHVLVVGGDDRSRRLIVAALRAHGYQVDEAVGGAEAAVRAVQSPLDLVILDVVLPSIDGTNFIRAQRQSTALEAVTTVIVAPIVESSAQEHYPHAIFVLYKPYDEEELLAVVDHVCSMTGPPASLASVASGSDLYWSRRGEIACPTHAPLAGSARWVEEAWAAVPYQIHARRIPYQCQHCSGRSPLQHRDALGSRRRPPLR
jgi:CheY-like chemotaxis protein